MGPLEFDEAPVAVDEDRLREPLIGMSRKNASEDFSFGRLRLCAQRRVEALGKQRRAHADLARPGAERQIALESQMLKGERDDAEDRNGDADKSRRWNPRPADRNSDGARTGAFATPRFQPEGEAAQG